MATDAYNGLPFEVRKILSSILIEYQLRDLLIERTRAINAHKSHLREIDSHIANVKKAIKETEPAP